VEPRSGPGVDRDKLAFERLTVSLDSRHVFLDRRHNTSLLA
jgi:hypothetical protein